MMTETEVDVQFQRATSELRVNETVNDVIFEYLQAFGATEAMWKLTVEGLTGIVAIDANGYLKTYIPGMTVIIR